MVQVRNYRLSKSRFIAGLQCTLRLWNSIHRPKLASKPDERQQAIFDTGHAIGELARERYPGGALIEADHRQTDTALVQTDSLMRKHELPALFEPAIQHNNVLTRVDVLARAGEQWDLVEVKASTRAKEVFQFDVAVQYWILKGAGIPVRTAGLLLLNRDYVYPGGAYDLGELFQFEDLTEFCQNEFDAVERWIDHFHHIASSSTAPDVDIGPHCHTPYTCPFWAHCSQGKRTPDNPIDLLPNLRDGLREALLERGVESIEAIPDDVRLSEIQERVRQATVEGKPWLSPKLLAALENVEWPLHFLDFEAAMVALPMYTGMRPFDALPFQFSCHTQRAPGEAPIHQEFLATAPSADPRQELAEHLIQTLGQNGSIVVYSGYEGRTIRELAKALSQLAPTLLSLQPRIVDLLAILRRHYYHPGFRGSYSIKQVLPTLVPEMSYAGMAIADGEAAGRGWLQMLASKDPTERDRLESSLRAYCQQDSLAMFHLREALLREATA
ncbi:DUF2779 domain-containing protein [Aquisalimonas sp. 2447]|uniref:DUF2779 domain-containing protein n=1 Tax=Aquisalimonas sp. 2447 TaxID=2740807 RepID=UPI001432738F|nr:DUF2779 domain-containing protein [Aquisalimonas sp. 2447]QIT54996.1 DUF2779 domain-containing protein [Aquisalimonas sp. 2447]